jgi:lipopolysaccharide export system permease protein
VWDGENWLLNSAFDRRFDETGLVYFNHHTEVILPEITVTPEDFIRSARRPHQMTFFELREYIQRLRRIGEKHHRELTDLHFKVAYPLANFIILLFCIPIAVASIRKKGRGLIFFNGILICFLYLALLRICQSLGYNEILSPVVAAWFPHIVFFIAGVYSVWRSEV